MSAFPPVSELIPHSGPALLLQRVTFHDEGTTQCELCLEEACQYVSAGQAEAALSLELIAQTAAVRRALVSQDRETRAGYVVGIPSMKFYGGRFLLGEVLCISVKTEFEGTGVGRFSGQVSSAGELRAEGTVTVVETST